LKLLDAQKKKGRGQGKTRISSTIRIRKTTRVLARIEVYPSPATLPSKPRRANGGGLDRGKEKISKGLRWTERKPEYGNSFKEEPSHVPPIEDVIGNHMC